MRIPMATSILSLLIALLSSSEAHAAPKICEDTDWHAQDGAYPECRIPNIWAQGAPSISIAMVTFEEVTYPDGEVLTRMDMTVRRGHDAESYCNAEYGQSSFRCYASWDLSDWEPFTENRTVWYTGTSPVTSLYCECI